MALRGQQLVCQHLSSLRSASSKISVFRPFSATMSSATSNSYTFSPPEITTVAVSTGEQFPVRRIYCVGQNYADHAIEMGHDPQREAPFFFAKPADALVPCGTAATNRSAKAGTYIQYPLATSNFHYEVELVVAIGSGGTSIPLEQASNHIFGYAVGIDLTRRDLQAAAKKSGRPWCTAKGFDESAPIGTIYPTLSDTDLANSIQKAALWLKVNGEERQRGTVENMIWSIPEIVSILSCHFELRPGDLIFTGTPAGVAALQPGDTVTAGVDGLGELAFEVIPRSDA